MKWPDDYENKVICGDCLEVMKGIPDNSVDLVLTDPPYGIGYSRHIENPKHDKLKNDSNLLWLKDFLINVRRILKDNGSIYCFCSWHNVDIFKQEIEKKFCIRNMLIWSKGGMGMGDLDTTYGCTYELCFYANQSPQILNGDRDKDVLSYKRSGNLCHPTQKPENLFKFLISKSSKENDLILDPFLGSGTTAVAAKQLGRRFIGIEISPEYCKIAEQRLQQEVLL